MPLLLSLIMPDIKLNSPLQFLKGVGPRKAEILARCGMHTVQDLLAYYPRLYLDRTNVVPIGKVKIDEYATIIGEVKAHGILYGKRRRYEVILQDDTGAISLLWFQGIRYWERLFKKGQKFAATGVVGYFMGTQMVHPDLERLDEDSDRMVHAGRIIPVYPQTAELNKVGLSSKGMRKLTSYVFDNLKEKLPDYVPEVEYTGYGLPSYHEAVAGIHYPDSREQIETCRRRLSFDELLKLQFFVYRNKGKKAAIVKTHRYLKPGEKLTWIKKMLPFELTPAQKKAVREIFTDLQKEHPMSRLLHGDVGCGKTVVAVLAALYAAENNLQCSFMAPTEILAEQHYRNWKKPLEDVGVRVGLVTSSLKTARKKKTAEWCADGQLDILFGTHALIYDYITFKRLGLVIIDEQHRFGVEQRGKLYAKGDNPDLLVMTATPIPRTLTLTLYGDLDVTTIDTLPPGRKPVQTVWRTSDALPQVYNFIADEIKKGGQVYIIYPLIEKSELLELGNVEEAYRELARTVFKDYRVALVHGRIKAKERDDILKRFREGATDILLSTTVIEVGIDNPNATVMIVENAERFGLAQLHQLRGRVGRGDKPAKVIAIAHKPISEIGRKRLEFFASENDGFKIAEADLMLRGPGEIFGVRQSGLPELKTADLWRDRDLLEGVRLLLENIYTNYNTLDNKYLKLYNYLKTRAAGLDLNLGGG
ncbi:MAG: ATP-dependent DNA helicase RecG [candidate division Zixibacteria bacterium]|nr:ATP-dependent DNA helicase RecG [candidate division Zixibacteria bacterium]